jgi:hypothetical protein
VPRHASLALLVLLLALPAANATPAHPDKHVYVASQGPLASPTQVSCADLDPLGGNMDPETGIGGACFPFTTQAGSDTGSAVQITVTDALSTGVTWIACIDLNGDGICASGVDEMDVCWTGSGTSGGFSLTSSGPCVIYEDPVTVASTLYVAFVARPGSPASIATRGIVTLT